MNHLAKRLNTALRKLASSGKKAGVTLGGHGVKRTPRLGRVRGGWPSSRRVWAGNRLCHVDKALARIRRYMSDSIMK